MKKSLFLSAAIALVTLTAVLYSCKSSSKASTGKVLKFNLEKGRGYDYEMIMNLQQEIMGKPTDLTIDTRYSVDVKEDQVEAKQVEVIYKSFRLNMDMMGMHMDINTDKPSEAASMAEEDIKKNPLGVVERLFSGIVGKKFRMTVDAEGNVLEVSGYKEIIQGMLDSANLPAEARREAEASLRDQFNEQSARDQFAQMFTIFPNKEVKVGDSWNKNYSTGGKMGAKFNTTYTVKSIEGDHVTMSTKTAITSLGEGSQVEMKGDQQGNVIVDSKTGLIINAEFTQDMTATTGGMDIIIKGKSKIKGTAH